uniref:Uncharacterized protein n=1 Tax=Cacopsylla melanoneura TaxID=428564 RepID=A0A8D8X7A2_9HEMI
MMWLWQSLAFLWRRSRRELEQLEVHRGKTMACKCKMKKICGFHVNSRRWGLGEHPFLRKTYSSGHRTIQAAPGIKSHGCGLDKIRIEHVLKKLKPLLRESSYSEHFCQPSFPPDPANGIQTTVSAPNLGATSEVYHRGRRSVRERVYAKFTRGVYPKFTSRSLS